MAAIITTQESRPRLDDLHPPPASFFRRYVFSIDHKVIGIQYMLTSLLFFIIAGLLAEVVGIQLLHPDGRFVSAQTYDQVSYAAASQLRRDPHGPGQTL
jgi:cytochrome c oxidase subunit 1